MSIHYYFVGFLGKIELVCILRRYITYMSKRIHFPQSSGWLNFSSNSANIDDYHISNNELSMCRKNPETKPFGYSLTEACNRIWRFVYEEDPSTSVLMSDINEILTSGLKKEIWKPKVKSTIYSKQDELKINENIQIWDVNFKQLNQDAEVFLARGFSPGETQVKLANFAWLSQYWVSYWNPTWQVSGVCGRFVTNAIRLRWSMPLWECDLDVGAWSGNEMMYHSFWKQNGCFTKIPINMVPNVKKYDLLARSKL